MDIRKKKRLNKNINRLSNSLFDAGVPLPQFIAITLLICGEARKVLEGETNAKTL